MEQITTAVPTESQPVPKKPSNKLRLKDYVLILVAAAAIIAVKSCWNRKEPIDWAVAVLKTQMKTPSSFSLIDGDVLWEGKLKDRSPAYIVKLSFDAQNLMGATVRQCALVAFIRSGEEVKWHDEKAINLGCENARALGGESGLVEMVKSLNFRGNVDDE